MALWANDVTYLKQQCKHVHTGIVYLSVGYMFTQGNHCACFQKAVTHSTETHIHYILYPHTSAHFITTAGLDNLPNKEKD